MTYEIGERINAPVSRSDANFDRACDAAYRLAILTFGIDDDGHSSCVTGWERSTCCVAIEFVRYVRYGNEHFYEFAAWVERSDE